MIWENFFQEVFVSRRQGDETRLGGNRRSNLPAAAFTAAARAAATAAEAAKVSDFRRRHENRSIELSLEHIMVQLAHVKIPSFSFSIHEKADIKLLNDGLSMKPEISYLP